MHRALLIDHACLLRQHGLGVVGRHAQKRNEPHPENCTRPAYENGTARTDDVARAHLRRHSGGKRLKRADTPLLPAAVQSELAERALHALAEAAHLHESRADGEQKPHGHQKHDQHVVRQVAVDGNDYVEYELFHLIETSYSFFPTRTQEVENKNREKISAKMRCDFRLCLFA